MDPDDAEPGICDPDTCSRCLADQKFLRRKSRQKAPSSETVLRVVDLFSGCGGMTLGFEEAARRNEVAIELALAVENDEEVLSILEGNFDGATTKGADVTALFDGRPGDALTTTEQRLLKEVGSCDALLGGPPCQGHSDLNNHTRRADPKNDLYLSMARAAEVLSPTVVVIENVPPVQWDTKGVVDQTWRALEKLDYDVSGGVVDLRRVGVPQRRRRYLLIASRVDQIRPDELLGAVGSDAGAHAERSVRWAIGDLENLKGVKSYDTASTPSPDNIKRISQLFDEDIHDLPNRSRPPCHSDKEHSYKSMYGRLWWDRPAQTITTGFGSMGQGRYVHPSKRRTITPHEAARLQAFPDWFDFGEHTRRGVLAKVIGNAVPPLLMVDLGRAIVRGLVAR